MPKGTKHLRREQSAGSFVVVLSTGQEARFHEMGGPTGASAWAQERLQGQPPGTYAAFYRAVVARGRQDKGAPWTEPFHVLIVNDHGRIVIGDKSAPRPERSEPFPFRGVGEAAGRARKPIAELISELRSWLPNYDHGPTDYPTILYRTLAALPGGDELEDMGYEPIGNLGWHEADQLGRVLEAIQDKRDVEDLIAGLISEEEEETEEAPRRRKR